MKPNISIIIPFLNESGNIPNLIEEINKFLNKNENLSIEVIFVNDGSTDDSIQILRSNKLNTFSSKIISFSKNFGSHAALRAGILNSKGEFITFMYADLQDPIDLISELYLKCKLDFDICWAKRNNVTNSKFDKIFSLFYSKLMKKFATSLYPENGFDIVMFNEKVKEQLNNSIQANSSIFLQILTLGFNQAEILYEKVERKVGKSKWSIKKKIKLFIDSFVSFSYAPIRLVSITGFLFFFSGISWTFYIILRKLIINDLPEGWPALTSILLLGFGITNISLGIIAEYLWRTLDEARKRPVFIIDEIIKL
ncbi:MAG: glycosyltransferase [Chitinophagaceae bacterium]|nr:glycosyltransferase [Chitinophagaceae bacterium]